MPAKDLVNFIESAKKKGASPSTIKNELLNAGWKESDINSALEPSSLGVVPPPPQHFGMWVAFLYIIMFISLYVMATSFGGMLHFVVDEIIPDRLDTVNFGQAISKYLIQGYIASLVVSFPVFASLSIVLKKQIIKNPAVKGLKVRKFLIYFTLVGTFLIMLGHVIGTVYSFLGGEVSTRAIAHLGVTLLVAGSIFTYYLVDVWGDRKQND